MEFYRRYFIIYMHVDELMTTLIKADLGCNIGGIYYDTVFYVDDIVLLSASIMKVQQILNICYIPIVINMEYI